MTPTDADLLRIGWNAVCGSYCKMDVIWEWRVNSNLTRTQCHERWDSLVRDKLIFYRSKEGWMITPEGLRLLNGGDQK